MQKLTDPDLELVDFIIQLYEQDIAHWDRSDFKQLWGVAHQPGGELVMETNSDLVSVVVRGRATRSHVRQIMQFLRTRGIGVGPRRPPRPTRR